MPGSQDGLPLQRGFSFSPAAIFRVRAPQRCLLQMILWPGLGGTHGCSQSQARPCWDTGGQALLPDSRETRLGWQAPAQVRCSVSGVGDWGLQPAVSTDLSVAPCLFLLCKLMLGHCYLRAPTVVPWAHWSGLEDKAGNRMARQQNQILLTSQLGWASQTQSTCSPGDTWVHVHQSQA